MKNYSERASELISAIITDITPILSKKVIEREINGNICKATMLDNDFATIWIKWGNKYDREFQDLPIVAMATIADNILSEQKGE